MQKYNILKPEMAIYSFPTRNCLVYDNNYDGYGIYLENNFLKVKTNFENHKSRVYNIPLDYCLTDEYNFEVEEVEVYQVLYE